MGMDGVEIRSTDRNPAKCSRCGAEIEWATEVATSRRIPINRGAVAWKTRFDRSLHESVETIERADLHSCPRGAGKLW